MNPKIIIIFLFISANLFSNEIYESYIDIYGEGPMGQYMLDMKTITYSKEDAVKFAKTEIFEFLTGMIYGYNFVYKVENNVTKQKGYFELKPIGRIKETDNNLSLYQILEKPDAVKIHAVYRLTDDQKSYIRGMQGTTAVFTMGEASANFNDTWDKRLAGYKEALKNSILNDAKKRYKARPYFITGRIFLKESPAFSVIHGEWKIVLKSHLIITGSEYQDIF